MKALAALAFCAAFLLLPFLIGAQEPPAKPSAEPQRVFLIGNSLTWDTLPSKLDGPVAWHVDCGKSLPYIFEHPAKPCVGSSTIWTNALQKRTFDVISLQPHYGATLAENVTVISTWAELQPDAALLIHSGWARSVDRAREWESKRRKGPVVHSRAWFDALVADLQEAFPERSIKQTHAQDLLALVENDIQAGKAPLNEIAELYRDAIHMRNESGRYLMHNSMRQALGQPRSNAGLKVAPKMKAYLDSVLDRHKNAD